MTSKRIQILQAIQSCAVTLDELSERINLLRKNIHDNVKACVQDGLLEKFRDDVTHLPAYKLTKAGLDKLASESQTKTTTTQAGSGEITPAAAHRATSLAPRNSGEGAAVNEPPPPEPTTEESSTVETPVAVVSDDMPTDKACCNAAKVVATTAGDVVMQLNHKINQQAMLIASLNEQIDALSNNVPVVTDRFIVADSYIIVKTESEANKTALRMAQEIEADTPVIVFEYSKARELRINWRDA